MIRLFSLFLISTAFSCSTPKTSNTNNTPVNDSTVVSSTNNDSIPVCIRSMIADFEKDPVQNPPRRIYRYTFKGKTVYYVPPICCDQYSNLYNVDCQLLGHPDGGFTGRGDGKFPEFSKEATGEKLIWKDKRK